MQPQRMFGAYGKIPALGDFFRAGLPPGFTGPWDAWLQAGLVAARAVLGDAWQTRYLSAPIWRFTLSAGVAGPQAALGVMMPSVDRVGRQFPLTFAAQAGTDAAQPLHARAAAVFAALEDLALDTLDDLPREALLLRLSGITLAPLDAWSAAHTPFTPSAPGVRHPCLWSTGEGTGTRPIITDGLPPPGRMHLFFAAAPPALPEAAPA